MIYSGLEQGFPNFLDQGPLFFLGVDVYVSFFRWKSIAWKCCFLKCVFSLAALRASLDKMLWQIRLCGPSEFQAHSTKPNYLVSARLRSSSFIHSDHFYSASSSPLLLRGSPDTALILCRSSTPKSRRPLRAEASSTCIRDVKKD